MRGDKIIVEPHHRRAAAEIADLIRPAIGAAPGRYVVSIAGESGAGKSEIALALSDALAENGVTCLILQQDDYFVYPPKTNAELRGRDIGRVGPAEVDLSLMDENLRDIVRGARSIEKPLVDFDDDSIGAEEIDLDGIDVVIIEGTYTTRLENTHTRIFIDRSRRDTRQARMKRAREEQDEYLERILEIEHGIIAPQKSRADIIITRDYHVRKNEPENR